VACHACLCYVDAPHSPHHLMKIEQSSAFIVHIGHSPHHLVGQVGKLWGVWPGGRWNTSPNGFGGAFGLHGVSTDPTKRRRQISISCSVQQTKMSHIREMCRRIVGDSRDWSLSHSPFHICAPLVANRKGSDIAHLAESSAKPGSLGCKASVGRFGRG